MKKINLKKLRLLNFKGSAPMEIEFSEKTSIYADNAVGKTRIVDAFLWLLFGKDSEDKSDFSIKPLDSKSNPISKVNVEVECILEINSREYQFMKVYKEKWTKKKGELEPELTGHETFYYVDLINVQKKDYDNTISGIIDIEIFKLITNPVYFEQKDRMQKRALLFSLVKNLTDAEIASDNESFIKLLHDLNGKDMLLYKKGLESQIRLMKNDLDLIPPRIDETIRQRPEELNFKLIDEQLLEKNKELLALVKERDDFKEKWKLQNEGYLQIKNDISALDKKLIEIKSARYSANLNEHSRLKNLLLANESQVNSINEQIRQLSKDMELDHAEMMSHQDNLKVLRDKWYTIRNSDISIKPDQTICPTCKRELDNIEEVKLTLIANFNNDKVIKLGETEKEAGRLSEKIASLQNLINTSQQKIDDLKSKIEGLNIDEKQITDSLSELKSIDDILSTDLEYNKLLDDKIELEKELKEPVDVSMPSDKKEKIAILESDIFELKQKLETQKQIDRSNDRIKELEQEMIKKAQEIANLEKIVYTVELFTRKKIELVESQINAKFSYVKFKLYNQLINGGEEETCITLINGVPYHSANYASRINAGLDIINVLCQHFDTYAPVFVDNCESISKLLPMNNQVIRLVKEMGTTKLRIENE